jgi:hypothetical protein
MTDNGSSSSDTLGITILTPGGLLWFSSAWNGTRTVEQSLGGGNLKVRPAQELAGSPAVDTSAVAPLTLDEIQPVAAAAIARWAAAGIDPQQLSALNHVVFQIDDLGGSDLAWEHQGVITLDRTADGYGWFIDPSPGSDAEFGPGAVDSPARGHIDLLSVVAHEMGHLLGYGEDNSDGVTGEYLAPGVRRVPVEVPAPLISTSGQGAARIAAMAVTQRLGDGLMSLDTARRAARARDAGLAPLTNTTAPGIRLRPRAAVLDRRAVDALLGDAGLTWLTTDHGFTPLKKGRERSVEKAIR